VYPCRAAKWYTPLVRADRNREGKYNSLHFVGAYSSPISFLHKMQLFEVLQGTEISHIICQGKVLKDFV
jgi:hypothetical protein